MIQLLKLREFTNKAGENVKFDKLIEDMKIPSLRNLFLDLDSYLERIPTSERWNIFYTIANCTENKREFSSTSTLAFDVDGTSDCDPMAYGRCASAVLGVNLDSLSIVASGNGVHVLIHMSKLIKSDKWFAEHKLHYAALCGRLNRAFKAANLQGQCDSSIFEARRILRLPGTENRKPNKPSKYAKLVHIGAGDPADIDLVALSGIPKVDKGAAILEKHLKRLPKADAAAIMEGCEFLKHAKANPRGLNEPQWYAALSITGRFGDGNAESHAISEGHPDYTREGTELKIKQAIEVSGPRTCKGIAGLWDGCQTCPNFEKVKSPILLQSEGFIASQANGFYKISWKGETPKYEPDYEGLVSYFDSEHKYQGYGDSRKVMVWNGTHFEPMAPALLEQYAMDHFDPVPQTDIAREFRAHVACTKIKPSDWWDESTKGFINLRNGVLNTQTWEFVPHSPERGFRYCLPFDFDETATCPAFDQLMEKVTLQDSSLQCILDEFGGYAVSGAPYYFPKMLMLVGEGSNGKSTWINILASLIGEDHIATADLYDLQKDPYKIATLSGKLLNISEETNRKAFYDSGMIKKLISTGIHQAREPYGATFYFRNTAKIIATCNRLPENFDSSHGLFRRLILVPFNAKFSSEDADFELQLDKKIIENELPGVFNRLLSGYRRLLKQGDFTRAVSAEKARADYLELSKDSVTSWVEEHLELDTKLQAEGDGAEVLEMYELYKQAAEAQGEKPRTMKAFSMRVQDLFCHAKVGIKRFWKEDGTQKRKIIGLKYIGEGEKSL